jgi:hypothetical protein
MTGPQLVVKGAPRKFGTAPAHITSHLMNTRSKEATKGLWLAVWHLHHALRAAWLQTGACAGRHACLELSDCSLYRLQQCGSWVCCLGQQLSVARKLGLPRCILTHAPASVRMSGKRRSKIFFLGFTSASGAASNLQQRGRRVRTQQCAHHAACTVTGVSHPGHMTRSPTGTPSGGVSGSTWSRAALDAQSTWGMGKGRQRVVAGAKDCACTAR